MAVFLSHHCALVIVVLVMTSACFFPTAETSIAATRIRSKRPHLQPVFPGGYRVYIVFLAVHGDDGMDYAAHRDWHASFLPSETTRFGQPRLRVSYTCIINGFSALLTDDEAKRVAQLPDVVRVVPSSVKYKRAYKRTSQGSSLTI